MANMVDELNAQFSLEGNIVFQTGKNDFPMAKITNELATAEVYLHGAHITAFQPKGSEPVLWMSPLAHFQMGKAIRGGVPVIWPWFGPHATDDTKPQHGFVRTAEWRVSATSSLHDGSTQLKLGLTDTPSTRELWPHAFELSFTVTVGTELKIELTSRNTGEQDFIAGGALHSYFAIGDVKQMFIDGLSECEYIDQLDGNKIKQQCGVVCITQQVDRIYLGEENTCTIHDTVLSRQIQVKNIGSHSSVVWNPWKDKAKTLNDFSNEEYRNMVCIEAANAADDIVQLAPGKKHTLSQIITLLMPR